MSDCSCIYIYPSSRLNILIRARRISNFRRPLRLLIILLSDIQRHQKPRDKIIARNRSRDLHNLLLAEMLLHLIEQALRHFHIRRHGVGIAQGRPLSVIETPG